jgi:adenylate cyclase
VAVLPVQNLTGDSSQDYICDGLTEELITQIVEIDASQLRVVPRTSSMVYKSASKTAEQIARELRVAYVIEGSLRASTGRLRVTLDVIHFPDQTHVWIREFDEKPADPIAMEDKISQSVAMLVAKLHSGNNKKL